MYPFITEDKKNKLKQVFEQMQRQQAYIKQIQIINKQQKKKKTTPEIFYDYEQQRKDQQEQKNLGIQNQKKKKLDIFVQDPPFQIIEYSEKRISHSQKNQKHKKYGLNTLINSNIKGQTPENRNINSKEEQQSQKKVKSVRLSKKAKRQKNITKPKIITTVTFGTKDGFFTNDQFLKNITRQLLDSKQFNQKLRFSVEKDRERRRATFADFLQLCKVLFNLGLTPTVQLLIKYFNLQFKQGEEFCTYEEYEKCVNQVSQYLKSDVLKQLSFSSKQSFIKSIQQLKKQQDLFDILQEQFFSEREQVRNAEVIRIIDILCYFVEIGIINQDLEAKIVNNKDKQRIRKMVEQGLILQKKNTNQQMKLYQNIYQKQEQKIQSFYDDMFPFRQPLQNIFEEESFFNGNMKMNPNYMQNEQQ